MMLYLYRGLTCLGGPLISYYLHRRKQRGKEDPARFHERLGRPRLPRPEGAVVWLHAASVGESLSMLPLIGRIQARPGVTVLVTTGTVTSAALMAQRLPPGAIHQYVPVDRMAYVRGFLDHWRPDLALWAESEFWPNLVTETARRGVPMVLLNGRISARSFQRWRRAPGFIGRLLGGFALCLGQTSGDAERLAALGAPRALCLGNLKLAAPPLPADDAALDALRGLIGARPVWLAASTHAGEEAVAARLHGRLAASLPGLLTIVAPRHPQRGADLAEELRGLGVTVARRGAGEALETGTGLYLADTMGELGLFYRLAPVVFVGKSLCGAGGQNPLEPARLGCAVLFGPHMDNFGEIAARMTESGAAEAVASEEDLAGALARLLADEDLRRRRGRAAEAFATAQAGVFDAVLAALEPFLQNLPVPQETIVNARA